MSKRKRRGDKRPAKTASARHLKAPRQAQQAEAPIAMVEGAKAERLAAALNLEPERLVPLPALSSTQSTEAPSSSDAGDDWDWAAHRKRMGFVDNRLLELETHSFKVSKLEARLASIETRLDVLSSSQKTEKKRTGIILEMCQKFVDFVKRSEDGTLTVTKTFEE